jgi:hypothetical protein
MPLAIIIMLPHGLLSIFVHALLIINITVSGKYLPLELLGILVP